ncbi:MAG TPA: 4'-phosphopantetheinyl transferase superfamily protein [Chitinophaga sp.]|uniref:4'-phosphopantetheinyl transferase family protein n=1 Tax=Chitinophaga sp. TaxID=1869181 RepID=UPI002CD890B0|nr:4'-phosphopantetheinyl transferase superfamily protein [Chitinophaga sp.]HVI45177.1 4'-phosphopantetheinyl transferase superfamily protein [Chitinophaga sp.]
MSVLIYYTIFKERIADQRFTGLLQHLPKEISDRVLRFRRWEDAHAGVLGKHLLLQALSEKGFQADLAKLRYTATSRPFLELPVDFNITHSGNMAACAVCTDSAIGIDVEEVKPLDFADFHGLFSGEEWKDIQGHTDPIRRFYHYWTIKEAVLKANGEGISQLATMQVLNEKEARSLNVTWYIKKIELTPGYVCHIATEMPEPEVIVKKIIF